MLFLFLLFIFFIFFILLIFVFLILILILILILVLFFLVLLLIKRSSHHPSVCFQPELKLSIPWLEFTTELRSRRMADLPLLNIFLLIIILLFFALIIFRADHNNGHNRHNRVNFDANNNGGHWKQCFDNRGSN